MTSAIALTLASCTTRQGPVVVIDPRQDQIVGFFPPIAEDDWNDGAREGREHLELALEDVAACLGGDRKIPIRIEVARTFMIRAAGVVALPDEWPSSVGAYLFRSGSRPRAVYASAGPSSMAMLLPEAVAEYFDAPECRREM